jgi:hypothetical protein
MKQTESAGISRRRLLAMGGASAEGTLLAFGRRHWSEALP